MKRTGLYISLVSVLLIILLSVVYIFLYTFDGRKLNLTNFQRKVLYGWQNRKTAWFLAKISHNSRIYKEFLSYEAEKDPTKRPTGVWRNEKVSIPYEGSSVAPDIQQSINNDSATIRGYIASWDSKKNLLTIKFGEKTLTAQIENFTLIYEATDKKSSQPFSRGPKIANTFTEGQYIILFVTDENPHPTILDITLLN